MRGKRSDLACHRYPDLTLRQGEVLDAIRRFISNHGYPPTHGEIGAELGIERVSTEILEKLEGAGYLDLGRRRQGLTRGIRLTERGLKEPVASQQPNSKGKEG